MFKWAVVLLATGGLYVGFYAFGLLQGAPLHPFGYSVSWAALLCGVAALFMGMKLRT
jgi:hypothetical protein